MKTLLCLALLFGSPAFAADAVIKVQSVPHAAASSPIAPGLIQGIAGIGQGVGPCMNCYGAPSGTIVTPPAYSIINPDSEPGVVYYYTVVDTANLSGTATFAVDLVQSSTGKVYQQINLLTWSTGGVPDHDGYSGAAELVFTTTLGTSTVQGRAYIWILPPE